MGSSIDQFREAWSDVRGLTYEFVQAVPEAAWQFSPHSYFAPFAKQVRHLVCVQGAYQQGLRDGVADFAKKHSHYDGGLERAALLAALHQKDAELASLLDGIEARGAEAFAIDFFGKTRGFVRYSAIMLQHEALHHGQWSLYAALGGFETPIGWKINWGL